MKTPRNIDPFVWFCVDTETRKLLDPYITPGNRASVFRRIPIQHLWKTRQILLGTLKLDMRIRYRGPRRKHRDHTLKEDAESFSLYWA